jgi:DNA repair photolyase
LEIISRHGFPVHILTKSDLVLRDLDLVKEISRVYAAISFTITTADDDLARIIEPGAPLPSRRFEAIRTLADAGTLTGVVMMPILPFLEDNEENIREIISRARDSGVSYIIPAFGVSLRPGSREYYYQKLDQHFPGVKEKYIQQYGYQYQCAVPNWQQLTRIFQEEIEQEDILSQIPVFKPQETTKRPNQMSLFNEAMD